MVIVFQCRKLFRRKDFLLEIQKTLSVARAVREEYVISYLSLVIYH
ncbi:MAG: hypothetical protein ACI9G1_005413 [Pirellulaceae bacterium]|jgi:hypothetical protein